MQTLHCRGSLYSCRHIIRETLNQLYITVSCVSYFYIFESQVYLKRHQQNACKKGGWEQVERPVRGGRGGVGGARFPAACRLPSNVCSVLPSIHFLTPSPPLSHFHTLGKKWKWPMQYLQYLQAIDTHWHQEAKLKSQVTSCLPPLLQCVLPSIHIFTLVFFVKSESDICRTCCKLL